MSVYRIDQAVVVFMADVQRYVPGFVTAATSSCVLVSLDDRMIPVVVDPANTLAISPAPSLGVTA